MHQPIVGFHLDEYGDWVADLRCGHGQHVRGEHVPGVRGLQNVRTRWIGHRMYAEADVVVDDSLLVREAAIITEKLQKQAEKHLPALASLRLALATGIDPEEAGRARRNPAPPHDHGDGHETGSHDHEHGEHGHTH